MRQHIDSAQGRCQRTGAEHPRGRRWSRAWTQPSTVLLPLLILAGCDLSVTNPGPVDDKFLNDDQSHTALVNGAQRALSFGLNRVNFYGLVVAHEMIASGGSANRGHSSAVGERGVLDFEEPNVNAKWAAAHRGRWLAEEAVRRMEDNLDSTRFNSSPLVARALVYAGFANRILGENMCFAVIDGGPAEPHTLHFQRAEEQFTRAIQVAAAAGRGDLQTAARAGRAQVRGHLGKWSEALSDAEAVPTSFVFVAQNHNTSQDENNKIVDANLASPWRSLSVHSTWFETYYRETGDPRTPFSSDSRFPLGDGRPVPWLFETKYRRDRTAPINLATGREMRLLQAEGALRAGNWEGALQIINTQRTVLLSDHTREPLSPRTASNITEAWTWLKLERYVELWLEGRMLGYQRAWIAESTPGPLPARFNMTGRSLCYPITISERRSNPNIPLAP
jgi:starch-binding outer membrane protein, SusD/RagB family